MYKLRPHQIKKSRTLLSTLLSRNVAYLAGEVRSGKTLTALKTADLFGAKNVLFITKKKAISSIRSDYDNFGFTYSLDVINYESLHKLESTKYDLIIYDEAHSLGAYPKPSKRAKQCKKMFYNIPCILMSGTPSVESYSQLYHQFYVSKYSPFKKYINFYRWADDFVDKKQMKLPTHTVTDYSNAREKDINKVVDSYFVKMTQADAGFESTVTETILSVKTPGKLADLTKTLLKDRVVEGKTGYIIGDTPAKLQQKVHQLINGHCIVENHDLSTSTVVLSHYKCNYIKDKFKGVKIAVMYYYKAELEMLKTVFGDDITTDIDIFNNSNKNIALQQSSTEGMNVSKADAIVFMNIGFSGKNYLQSRDRLTIKGRKDNKVFFVCEDFGFTKKVVKAVKSKQDYNVKLFKKDW